ncbi:hypothetical protein BCE02nite_35110 [Brevibacillus centrosporus]|nr:hypothetical protein BCE02nite_35110 [Brevibacillus centrosporus]
MVGIKHGIVKMRFVYTPYKCNYQAEEQNKAAETQRQVIELLLKKALGKIAGK